LDPPGNQQQEDTMTEQPQSGSDNNEEDTEGHVKRRFADQESTEGEEDTEGHRRLFADQESTEGETAD
jgi:hypothetical protein